MSAADRAIGTPRLGGHVPPLIRPTALRATSFRWRQHAICADSGMVAGIMYSVGGISTKINSSATEDKRTYGGYRLGYQYSNLRE